jgi:ribose/xylose/arabinose/galactoside ABC-type transport system permease subunit
MNRSARSALIAAPLDWGLILVLVAVYALFSIAAPSFFGLLNLIDIFHVMAPTVVIAAGMALIVMSGNLDISVGSTAYVASAIFAVLVRDYDASVSMAVMAALAAGLILGLTNAVIIVFLKVNSLIATLGTLIAFRGIGLSLTNGGLINLPEDVRSIGNLMAGPIFADTLIAVAILFGIHILHRRTNFGRHLTAIGNDVDVARRVGVPVERRLFAAFLLAGFLGAAGGLMATMQVGVNTAKIGEGMEFIAIAVVVVGGVSLFGGRGNILKGVLLGALAFQMIRSGLQHSGANPYSFRLVEGVVIFIAMYMDALKRRK